MVPYKVRSFHVPAILVVYVVVEREGLLVISPVLSQYDFLTLIFLYFLKT